MSTMRTEDLPEKRKLDDVQPGDESQGNGAPEKKQATDENRSDSTAATVAAASNATANLPFNFNSASTAAVVDGSGAPSPEILAASSLPVPTTAPLNTDNAELPIPAPILPIDSTHTPVADFASEVDAIGDSVSNDTTDPVSAAVTTTTAAPSTASANADGAILADVPAGDAPAGDAPAADAPVDVPAVDSSSDGFSNDLSVAPATTAYVQERETPADAEFEFEYLNPITVNMACPADKVGTLIGKKGSVVNEIMRRSNCKVYVEQRIPDGLPKQVVLTGLPKRLTTAMSLVSAVLEYGPSVVMQNSAEIGRDREGGKDRESGGDREGYRESSSNGREHPANTEGHSAAGESSYSPSPSVGSSASASFHAGSSGGSGRNSLRDSSSFNKSNNKHSSSAGYTSGHGVFYCPQDKVGSVIGSKGCNVQEIYRRTGCRVVVVQDGVPEGVDREVIFNGSGPQVNEAREMVTALIRDGPEALSGGRKQQQQESGGVYPVSVPRAESRSGGGMRGGGGGGGGIEHIQFTDIDPSKVSTVIGAKGSTIHDIMARSGCRLVIRQDFPAGMPHKVEYSGSTRHIEVAKFLVEMTVAAGVHALHRLLNAHNSIVALNMPLTDRQFLDLSGPHQSVVHEMQMQFGVKIVLFPRGDPRAESLGSGAGAGAGLFIVGGFDSAQQAKVSLQDRIYMAEVTGSGVGGSGMLAGQQRSEVVGVDFRQGLDRLRLDAAAGAAGAGAADAGVGVGEVLALGDDGTAGKLFPARLVDSTTGMYEQRADVRNEIVGKLIGKQGASINLIQSKSGASLQVGKMDGVPLTAGCTAVMITGQHAAVALAAQMVQEVLVSGIGKLLQMADVPSTVVSAHSYSSQQQQPRRAPGMGAAALMSPVGMGGAAAAGGGYPGSSMDGSAGRGSGGVHSAYAPMAAPFQQYSHSPGPRYDPSQSSQASAAAAAAAAMAGTAGAGYQVYGPAQGQGQGQGQQGGSQYGGGFYGTAPTAAPHSYMR